MSEAVRSSDSLSHSPDIPCALAIHETTVGDSISMKPIEEGKTTVGTA